jgi:hypothetical protein
MDVLNETPSEAEEGLGKTAAAALESLLIKAGLSHVKDVLAVVIR